MNNNRKNLIDALGAIGLRDLSAEGEFEQAYALLKTLTKNSPEEEVKRTRKKRAPSQKAVAPAKVEPVVKAQPEPVIVPTPLEKQVETGVAFEEKKPKKAPALKQKVESKPFVPKVEPMSKIEQIAAQAAESAVDGPGDDAEEDDSVKEIAHDDLPEHLR